MLDCAQRDKRLDVEPALGKPRPARYAIYFTPQPGSALACFGRSWFGRANDGATLDAFSTSGHAASGFARRQAGAGRFGGLHAVFREPFALRDGMTPDALKARLATFAEHRKPVTTGPLTLVQNGRCLELRPIAPTPTVDWLANQCVSAFENFAVVPAEHDQELYRHLSPHQRLLLLSFGQSRVMSEFRFSITLAGPLDATRLLRVSQALQPVLADICAEGIAVDGLSLIGDAGDDMPMRMIGRYGLRG